MVAYVRSLPVFVAIYGIIFSQISDIGRNNFLTVVVLVTLYVSLSFLLREFQSRPNLSFTEPYLKLFLIFMGITLVQVALGRATARDFLSMNYGFILAGVITLYLGTFPLVTRFAIFNRLTSLLAVGFVLQLALSIYESRLGHVIAAGQGWWLVNEQTDTSFLQAWAGDTLYRVDILQHRFIGNAIWPQMSRVLFGNLTLPFSGMLGQHNYWGSELPFINLLFIMAYWSTRRRVYLVLLPLVFFAILMNTSRFGIAAIFVTDIALFLKLNPRRGFTIAAGAITLGLAVLAWLSAAIVSYFFATDTLTGRLATWPIFVDFFGNSDFVTYLFGFGPRGAEEMGAILAGYSLENQLLLVLFNYGSVGALAILLFVRSFRKTYRRLSSFNRLMLSLIGINVVAVSILSDLVFHYSTLLFVVLLLLNMTWRADLFRQRAKLGGRLPTLAASRRHSLGQRDGGVFGAALGGSDAGSKSPFRNS